MAKGIIEVRIPYYKIQCSECGKPFGSNSFENSTLAQQYFLNCVNTGCGGGWRFYDNGVYCPHCGSKFEQPGRWICECKCEICYHGKPHEKWYGCSNTCAKCIPYREFLEKRIGEVETTLLKEEDSWAKNMNEASTIKTKMLELRGELSKLRQELSKEGA